jgi:hypothetical protein
MAAAKVLDEVGTEVRARGAERAELRRPRAQLADRADRHASGVDRGQRGLGVRAQRASRLGGDEAAADALEERNPELRLEPPDLFGQRRLGEVQRLGGGAERAVLERREDIPKLLQIHRLCLEVLKTIKATPRPHKGRSCQHDHRFLHPRRLRALRGARLSLRRGFAPWLRRTP